MKSFVSSTAHESTGGGVHNLDRNSHTNVHDYGDRNRNANVGNQFAIQTPSNYDSNGRVISDDLSGKLFVSSTTHESTGGGVHNPAKNSQANVNDYGDKSRNADQGNQSSKGTTTNYDPTGRDDHNSKSLVASTITSDYGSGQNRISYSTSTKEVKENVGHNRDTYHEQSKHFKDDKVSEIFDENKKFVTVPSEKNYESSGIVTHSHNYSNVQLKEKENVVVAQNRTSYASGVSVVTDRNVNPIVTSTKANHEPGKAEVRNPNQMTFGTKGKEVTDQKNRIVSPIVSNGASSTTSKSIEKSVGGTTSDSMTSARKTTTSTTTTTTTTTTTAKPQTSAKMGNSQRTYRSLRKDTNRVTFEPEKRGCDDLTVKRNGIYKFGSMDEIANDGNRFFYERYCDFYTDNRAWTVIQRRFADDSEESFNRTWGEYKHGFGSLDDEFWFGNDFIHQLTFDNDVELRILLQGENGKTNWMGYSLFKLKSEQDNFKLVIGGYSSDSVGDSLLYHNDQEFSTYDHRNNQQTSCASSIGNGWWFKNCADKGILGNFLGSTSTKMMIRPKKFK